MSRILLHCCCGPCAMYPIKDLLTNYYDKDEVTLFWYNPNIHPEFEWNRRYDNLVKVSQHYGLNLIKEEGYKQELWDNKSYVGKYKTRCEMCYDLRLGKVCEYAGNNGFDKVSTTLLVSPYQQHDVIKEYFINNARENGVEFDYHDWRDNFRLGQNMAREIGLYRQKYCGCINSLDESEFKEKILRSFGE